LSFDPDFIFTTLQSIDPDEILGEISPVVVESVDSVGISFEMRVIIIQDGIMKNKRRNL
jgi:hypothetical protein